VPKTCYLHVGLHKTASSSFQSTCENNVDLLQKAGITYPVFSCAVANQFKIVNHSIPIFSLFTEKPERYRINIIWDVLTNISKVNSSYENQLVDYLSSSDDLLISGEDISMMSAQSLSRFVEKIQKYNYQLKAIALIRSPYSLICSEIQQRAKSGYYINLISLNNCVPTSFNVRPFRKLEVVKKLKSFFGDSIKFSSFEHACANSYGPVGFLLEEFLGQNPSAFEYQKTNESIFNLSTRIQNEFNAVNPSIIDGRFNPQFKIFPAEIDKKFEFSGKFLLTEAEYALIEDFVKNETEILSEITGLDLFEQSVMFSKPIF